MSKGTILIVEPDEGIRNMVRAYLGEADYQVFSCTDYDHAMEMTRHVLPSLIVTEIDLPDKSGYELLRELRQNTRTSHIPIIAVSFRDKREDKIRALELGIDDYVTKPFDMDELKKRIEAAIMAGWRLDPVTNLTGLPRGYQIEEYLRKIMQGDKQWIYIDIEITSFDAYKQVYDWNKGDKVLIKLADLLREVWQGDFVGHPGGDNFVIVTKKLHWRNYLNSLLRRFNDDLLNYYEDADFIKQGFVVIGGVDRPLMSLSFGSCDTAKEKVSSVREITELAAEDRRRKDPNYVANQDDDQDILMEW
jgi:PleD family two-component response regulator